MTRPVAAGLFEETPDGPRLLGAACRRCGVVTFPRQGSCPRCTALDMQDRPLAREGALWSWTIQCFAPKSPPYAGAAEDFVPYGVGYIELPGEVRVEALLTESDPGRLEIGMPMRLTLIPAPGNAGTTTFAFEPVA